MSHGRKGSNQEKVDAIPLDPANNANTGVMQHKDALKAVNMLVIANELDFLPFMLFLLF
ncbi:MAG: hypothetical protein ACJAZM_003085 [Cyclobacteriaceae bacterium]|jgi:hypothetical protein